MHTTALQQLFPGFRQSTIVTSGAAINTMVDGQGPALLLLHGHPQTMACWHKVAPALARHFTVVLTDLRGYGDSSKPEGGTRHVAYSKRQMALDQVEVMRQLGFARFQVAAHDRGGRVAHRMLLDHPQAVERAALMDIAPTATMYANVNKEFATRYVWWFFLIQPAPLPERLIGADPAFYLQTHLGKQNKTRGAITPASAALKVALGRMTAFTLASSGLVVAADVGRLALHFQQFGNDLLLVLGQRLGQRREVAASSASSVCAASSWAQYSDR
jgi:haloacetate dehalogenase